MSIALGSIITWSELATVCYNAIINNCCNIDSLDGVPLRLQDGYRKTVYTQSQVGISGSQSKVDFAYEAVSIHPIGQVSSSTVNSQWTAFLTVAGIDVRSNKVIQANELGLVIGLYQQFLSFHVKPVYSRGKVYGNMREIGTENYGHARPDDEVLFEGMYYTGSTNTLTPKYTLTGIDPDNVPSVTNNDIERLVDQNLCNIIDADWGAGLLDYNEFMGTPVSNLA